MFNKNVGVRVFSYCRIGGKYLGLTGQVIVIANCGESDFPLFEIEWFWGGMMVKDWGNKSAFASHFGLQSRAWVASTSGSRVCNIIYFEIYPFIYSLSSSNLNSQFNSVLMNDSEVFLRF